MVSKVSFKSFKGFFWYKNNGSSRKQFNIQMSRWDVELDWILDGNESLKDGCRKGWFSHVGCRRRRFQDLVLQVRRFVGVKLLVLESNLKNHRLWFCLKKAELKID